MDGVSCVEEVLSTDYALWWSPDGEQIVYLTFNDTNVESFQFPFYGPLRDAYTVIHSIAYPKVHTYTMILLTMHSLAYIVCVM